MNNPSSPDVVTCLNSAEPDRTLGQHLQQAVRSPRDSSRRIDAIWELRDPGRTLFRLPTRVGTHRSPEAKECFPDRSRVRRSGSIITRHKVVVPTVPIP